MYISRKRKLLKEIQDIASCAPEEFGDNAPALAEQMCSIFSRFDLGENLDDEAATFLEALDEADDPSSLYEQFTKLMCRMYETVGSVKDYSDSPSSAP